MADIENLSIQITASETAAVNSLDKLAKTLERIKKAVNGAAPTKSEANRLRDFAQALNAFRGVEYIRISSTIATQIGRIGTAIGRVTTSDIQRLRDLADALRGLNGVQTNVDLRVGGNVGQRAAQAAGINPDNAVEPGTVAANIDNTGNLHQRFLDLRDAMMQTNPLLGGTRNAILNLHDAEEHTSAATSFLGNAFHGFTGILKRTIGGVGNFISSIARIAKYRFIRTLIKDMGQSFKDLYGWSDLRNTAFAKSIDSIITSARYFRNSIAAMAAPLVNMLAPAFETVTNVVVDAINWINQFFAAISGADTYTVARRVAATWGDALEGTQQQADKLKRTILGFDEINALQKDNSGSGKSPYTEGYETFFEELPLTGGFKGFSDAIETALQDTLSRITMIVSGAVLAVGAILTFTGANIPLGIGLMAAGAVGLGSAILANWDGVSDKVKQIVGAIEAAVSVALLAVGAILTFSGANIGLGIGLMIAGLATGFGAVTLAWDSVGDTVGKKIQAIMTLVGGAMLGIGAVIAFAGHPGIGIAMMIAGASVAAVSINWDYIADKLRGPIGAATALVSGASLVLGVLAIIGGNVPLGLGLILAGIGGLAATAVANWDDIKSWFKDTWEKFKTAAESTWDKLKEIGAGIWGKIKEGISGAIEGVGNWIKDHIFKPFVDAWHWLLGIFGGGDDETNVTMNASSVGEQIIEETDTETMQQLKELGASMGDAIKAGLLDKMNGVADDIWKKIKSSWKNNDRILTVAVKTNVVRGDWSDTAYLAANMEDSNATRTITSIVQKGSWDKEAWSAAGLTSYSPIRTVTATVKKGNWDNTAWLAASMTSYLITRTLTAVIRKGAWDATAWLAANMTTFAITRTITSILKKGAWDASAWLAANMTVYAITRTVSSIVRKGSWDATAWLAANMTTYSVTRTVKSDVRKGSWNDTAWLAANLVTYAITRTVTSIVNKGNWNDTAWTAAMMTTYGVIRTVNAVVNKGSWNDTAWLAATMTNNTTTRTVQSKVEKSTWNDNAWLAATMTNYIATRTVKVELKNDGWTTITKYLDDNFGGATGGGGQTSGGGAGRNKYYVSIGLKDPTDSDATTFWGKLQGVWDSAVLTVDKGLDVIVRPVMNKSKSVFSSIFDKIGTWLFGKSDTPTQDVIMNAKAGTGLSRKQAYGYSSNAATGGYFTLDLENSVSVTVNAAPGTGFKNSLSSNKFTLDGINAIDVLVALKKSGWTTIAQYVGTRVDVYISLLKSSWFSIAGFVGTHVDVYISLWKSGWYSISGFVGTWVDVYIYLNKGNFTSLASWIGNSVTVTVNLAKGGGRVNRNGYSAWYAADGGIISNNIWRKLPKYASGTSNAHGTMFVAGEAGPEIVGHIGGRTEILNQSQLAQVMFAAVRSAMSGVKIGASFYDGSSSDNESDYDTMYQAMYDAVSTAMSRGNELDRQRNEYLRQINEKDFTAEVTTRQLNNAQRYVNRRAGTTVVAVGG